MDTLKITVHIVSSLDGIIAKKDNSISWFDTTDHYEKGATVAAQDAAEFVKSIDCYVMGARTYEHALALSKKHGWAYGDTPTIVLSNKGLPIEQPGVEICFGDLNRFVNERLKPHYKNVWVVGGAMLIRDFLDLKLADEIRLSVMPIILGEGTMLFDHIGREQALHLKNVTPYKSGMVELHYEVKK